MNPPLRSAFAAGEREPGGSDTDELIYGLFGPDADEDADETAAPKTPSAVDESSFEVMDQLEGRDPKILRGPARPSAEAVDKHNAIHRPYRSWCPVCVSTRGKESAHRRKRAEDANDNELARVSLDYQELKSKAKKGVQNPEDKTLKIVVMKDEPTGCVNAHRVDAKGPSDAWVVKRLVKDVEELGRRDIALKTDGEPAMIAMQRAIAAQRPGLTKPENPPAYNPQSNGACEKAVQDVSAQIRTLTVALESRLGDKFY